MAQWVKDPPAMQETQEFDPWVKKIPWRRKQQLTPVFLPGKLHGQRSPVGYSPMGHKESDRTEWLSTHKHTQFNLKSAFVNIRTRRGFFLKIIWSSEKSAINFVRHLLAWKMAKKILVAFYYFLLKYWWLIYYISFKCTTQWFNTSINYTLYTFITVLLTVFTVLYISVPI